MRLRARRNHSPDTEELRTAYEQHGAVVYAVASYLAGIDAAEQVTAQVFLDLWRHPDAFDSEPGSLRLCLIAATHRTCAPEGDRAGGQYEADEQPIRSALARLSGVECEAVLTVKFGSCSYHEAAAAMHVKDTVLRLHLGHGLESLGATLRRRSSARSEAE